jgi:hypothetical protein
MQTLSSKFNPYLSTVLEDELFGVTHVEDLPIMYSFYATSFQQRTASQIMIAKATFNPLTKPLLMKKGI